LGIFFPFNKYGEVNDQYNQIKKYALSKIVFGHLGHHLNAGLRLFKFWYDNVSFLSMHKSGIKKIWHVLLQSFKGFKKDRVAQLSGSLSYSTVFSLGPLLIVLIYLCGLFFGEEAIQGTIYAQAQDFVGKDGAAQLQTIIKNAAISNKGTLALVIGIITLLLGATAVFGEIQTSINAIWGLKAKPKRGFMHMLRNRLLSFSMIVSLGFLLLVSLAVSTAIEAISNRLKEYLPNVSVVLFYVLSLMISFIVITVLFSAIFKVLPDAQLKWKEILPGAIASGILFMIGKFAISFYISRTNVGSTYGAAGSLVILLLWVYYSAMILYLGAEFSKAWILEHGHIIKPNSYAIALKEVEVETNSASKRTHRSN